MAGSAIEKQPHEGNFEKVGSASGGAEVGGADIYTCGRRRGGLWARKYQGLRFGKKNLDSGIAILRSKNQRLSVARNWKRKLYARTPRRRRRKVVIEHEFEPAVGNLDPARCRV